MEAIDRENTAGAAVEQQKTKIPAEVLARRIADIAADKKAVDIVLLDIRPVSYVADYFLICTGESDRQIKAIIDALRDTLGKEGVKPVRSEGTSASGWILLDYGDIVVHVFSPTMRSYYLLEKVWGNASLVLRVQ